MTDLLVHLQPALELRGALRLGGAVKQEAQWPGVGLGVPGLVRGQEELAWDVEVAALQPTSHTARTLGWV